MFSPNRSAGLVEFRLKQAVNITTLRKFAGYTLLVLSVVAWAAIATLPFLDVSFSHAALITTALLIGGEIAFFTAVALLGKEIWAKLKSLFRRPEK